MSEQPSSLDMQELSRQMLAVFRSPRYLPPLLPVMAVEIIALSQEQNDDYDALGRVLAKDPLLAARVIDRCQVSYARREDLQSFSEAMRRLGIPALKRIIFDVSLNTRVFQTPGYTEALERLRVHSVATAHLAKLMCDEPADREIAFLAGLLHDVGMAGLFVTLSELPGGPSLEEAWPDVLKAHCEASGALARLWRLPRRLQLLLAHHHDVLAGGRPSPLAATLVLAERFAFELAPLVGDDPSVPGRAKVMPGKDLSNQEGVRAACAMLQVDAARWGKLRAQAAELLATVL